ncbi:hypothetical protein [Microcoleus sp. F4-D5]|uniref:hypothetical protein n=1 Tax=Microcoleus sp. F4-D5 TaxID=2818760 RepID=UPI002FD1CD97
MVIGKLFERPTIETDFTLNNFGNGARTQEGAIGKQNQFTCIKNNYCFSNFTQTTVVAADIAESCNKGGLLLECLINSHLSLCDPTWFTKILRINLEAYCFGKGIKNV